MALSQRAANKRIKELEELVTHHTIARTELSAQVHRLSSALTEAEYKAMAATELEAAHRLLNDLPNCPPLERSVFSELGEPVSVKFTLSARLVTWLANRANN